MPQQIEGHKGFRGWHEAGFGAELLPIIPPGATLTPGTEVRAEHRGKTPGVLTQARTWSGLGGKWSQDLHATISDLKAWTQWGASVGLQARDFPGLDIDVEDAAAANEIQELAYAYLGFGPVRVRDGSARRLIMFKRPSAHEPIRKVRMAWTDKAGGKHAVELLGHGQQYVVEGPHPKGGAYAWLGETPCDCGPSGIGEITGEHVEQFFTALARLVKERGWSAPNTSSTTATGASGARKGLDNPALHAPRPALVLEALAAWPNTLPTHDDFVAALVAIKAALGPDREDHYGAVEDWALGYDGNDADYVRKTWDSIGDASVGWEWLAGAARAAGDFSADAQDDFDEGEEAGEAPADEIGETAIERMVARYVWVEQLERYADLHTGAMISARAFNAANTSIAEFGRTGINSAEATFQNTTGAKKAKIATFRPGQPALLWDTNQAGHRVRAVNLWRAPSLATVESVTIADVALWLAHVEEIFGPDGDPAREHFLNWCAYLFQQPGRKINHALVLLGEQGVGKDTVFAPIFAALGGPPNVTTIKTENLVGQWTNYLLSQVVVVQEMMNFTRRELYNKLKDMTAAPPLWLEVNKKNQNQFTVPNIQNWVIFTNNDDAIALDADDRRFWVHRSYLEVPKDEAYYDALYTWFAQPESAAKVAAWLKQRDIATFNPSARPPHSQAKADMIESAMPATIRYLVEQLEQGGAFAGRELLLARDLVQHARSAFDASPKAQEAREKHAVAALRRAGYRHVDAKIRFADGSNGRLWTSAAPHLMEALGPHKLRARYEAETMKTEAKRAGA